MRKRVVAARAANGHRGRCWTVAATQLWARPGLLTPGRTWVRTVLFGRFPSTPLWQAKMTIARPLSSREGVAQLRRLAFERMRAEVGVPDLRQPIPPAPDRTVVSYAQQRLWLAHQLDPGSIAYNVPIAVRLCGPLNIAAL